MPIFKAKAMLGLATNDENRVKRAYALRCALPLSFDSFWRQRGYSLK